MTQQAAILESIRDIIAGKENPAADNEDILDLTQKLNEDGSITDLKLKSVASAPEEKFEEEKVESVLDIPDFSNEKDKSGDILSEIDALLSEEKPKAAAALESFEEIEIELADKPAVAAPAEPFEEITKEAFPQKTLEQETPMSDSDVLISDNSASTAKASIANLMSKLGEANKAKDAPNFRSGDTVEDIVAEMLRPMMKQWLDDNLPKLVNQVVEREIAKIMASQ